MTTTRRSRTFPHAATRDLCAIAALVVTALLLVACGGEEGDDAMRGASERGRLLSAPDGAVPADAARYGLEPVGGEGAGAAPSASTSGAPGDGGYRRRSSWGVLLGTYSGPTAMDAAANQVRTMATQIDPRLADARVHRTRGGALVVYGRYGDAEDPGAQQALRWIKELRRGERMIFPRAILTRVTDQRAAGEIRPIELLSVRKQYPDLNPLYTLQIAAWGTFDSPDLVYDDVAEQAELQARRLRAQGLPAYVHHDPDLEISSVTVGVFDRTAVDLQAGMELDPRLRQYRDRFPAHLVNGEELQELVSTLRPELGRVTQRPRLVEIPRLR